MLPFQIHLLLLRTQDIPNHPAFTMRLKPLIYELCRSQILLKRSELLTTETELMAIAAAANTGFRSIPKNGYSIPAAIGIPRLL